jgi:ParB family transcriptional regulator, chromosome partitioning protein
MTIQSIPLSSILPPEGNPRAAIDQAGIEGLAASIQADGLLQNLVVAQLNASEV